MIDIGGQTSLRGSWSQYFQGTTAIILVIDSSDAGRLGLAKTELDKLVKHEVSSTSYKKYEGLGINIQELASALLLVLANKQDLPNKLTPAQVSEGLGLTALREREWQIMGCSALTGEGLFEGMDWMVSKLESK